MFDVSKLNAWRIKQIVKRKTLDYRNETADAKHRIKYYSIKSKSKTSPSILTSVLARSQNTEVRLLDNKAKLKV